uniref:Uncharacterized protein n=1 Tax=Physcomitrium patens TaxID=3218 RepID=A0A2K1J0G1_PHYPA|nr:hypothetical protein PHYPA_022914 [Physcomitrium patens]
MKLLELRAIFHRAFGPGDVKPEGDCYVILVNFLHRTKLGYGLYAFGVMGSLRVGLPRMNSEGGRGGGGGSSLA